MRRLTWVLVVFLLTFNYALAEVKVDASKIYHAGVQAMEAGDYSKASDLFEGAFSAGLNDSNLINETNLNLYYLSIMLQNQRKIKLYEDKCRASGLSFRPFKRGTPFKIELSLVVDNPDKINSVEYEAINTISKHSLVVNKKRYDLTNLISKSALLKGRFDGFTIQLQLNKNGTSLLNQITKANIKKRIAIIINGTVFSIPTIQQALTDGNMLITGMNVDLLWIYTVMKMNKIN